MAEIPKWDIDLNNLQDAEIHVIYTPDKKSEALKSGDEANAAMWIMLMGMSALGVTIAGRRRRAR